ncbi:hypothetical protein GGF31_008918 [Allomyces arbusculus]|nr:hypothetical protein GGF31_008918 [Allomyces arbusculus]
MLAQQATVHFEHDVNECPGSPAPPQYKVVATAGKVRTRAAAEAACQTQGLVLAAVTLTNWDEVTKVLRDSLNTNQAAFDAVLIDSWNGDTYGSVDRQLVVSKFGGAALSLLGKPAYPLCVTATGGSSD